MSIQTLYDRDQRRCVLYDTVTETAFSPVFIDEPDDDAVDQAYAFLKNLARHPKYYTSSQLNDIYDGFIKWRRARMEAKNSH